MVTTKKTGKPTASTVSKMNRTAKIRQEVLAAKGFGVDAPWQIASGERFTVAKIEKLTPPRPQFSRNESIFHSVQEQDRDFVYRSSSEAPFNLSSILSKNLSDVDRSAALAEVRKLSDRLDVNNSVALRKILSESISRMLKLGVHSKKMRAVSARLDEKMFPKKRKYTNIRGVKGGGWVG